MPASAWSFEHAFANQTDSLPNRQSFPRQHISQNNLD
jgi:hypothetical protein